VGESGGAVYFEGLRGSLTVINSQLSDNIVFGWDGGAIAFVSAEGAAAIEGCRFERNVAYRSGGAIYVGDAARAAVARTVVTAQTTSPPAAAASTRARARCGSPTRGFRATLPAVTAAAACDTSPAAPWRAPRPTLAASS
jgi:predicted outer membrane repeat protein